MNHPFMDAGKFGFGLKYFFLQISKSKIKFLQLSSFPKTKLKLNFLEMNEFADMTDDEFADEKLGEMESPEDEPATRIFLSLIHI